MGPYRAVPGGAGPASGGPIGLELLARPRGGQRPRHRHRGGPAVRVGIDTSNGYAYVANEHTNNVTVINGTKVIAAIAVGRGPQGAIYDPNNGYMYITNTGSDNLTVINVTKIVGWVDDGELQRAGPGRVRPVERLRLHHERRREHRDHRHGLKVVNSVTVGRYALGAAYDPAEQDVYVTATGTVAQGGSSVSVISGQAVVGTISRAGPATTSRTPPRSSTMRPQATSLWPTATPPTRPRASRR